jgi:opacity protein-like surface antigen
MKKIRISIIAILTLSIFSYAGGDIYPNIYEQEDIQLANSATIPQEEPETIIQQPKEEIIIEPIKEEKVIKKEKKEIIPSGFYAGIGITGSRYNPSCNCPKGSAVDKAIALLARVGYDFNQYIGIEARGMRTVAKEDGSSVTHAGLFLKPMYHITNFTNLYALIGTAKTKVKGDLQKVDAEGLALGGGVEFDLSKDKPKEGIYSRKFDGEGDQEKGLGLFLDYERLIVKDNAPKLDTISAGVTYDF